MIDIDFKDFLLTGKFGDFHVGMSRFEFFDGIKKYFKLKRNKNYSIENFMKEEIWLFGNIEFSFDVFSDSNNRLDVISTDCFDINENINGGNIFNIKNNLFELNFLSLNLILNILNQNNIEFKFEEYKSLYLNRKYLRLSSNIQLIFDNTIDKDKETLNKFVLKTMSLHRKLDY